MPAPRGPIFFAVKEGKIFDESRDPELRSVLLPKLKLVKRQMYGRGKLDLLKRDWSAPHGSEIIRCASEPFFHADPDR